MQNEVSKTKINFIFFYVFQDVWISSLQEYKRMLAWSGALALALDSCRLVSSRNVHNEHKLHSRAKVVISSGFFDANILFVSISRACISPHK